MYSGTEKLLIEPDGTPKPRIIGFETEYAVKPRQIADGTENQEYLTELAARFGFRSSDNQGGSPNIFVEDGDREYLDLGYHPELSTAEDISFEGAAFRVARGHVKMAKRYSNVAQKLNTFFQSNVVTGVDLIANTCDPETMASWGSHQNYLARRALDFKDFIPAFTAHHSTRIVWSGVGRVLKSNVTKGGYEYSLSEKAPHMYEEVSLDTMHSRALINTRDEAESNPYLWRRIHDVSGETAMNPYVNAMRMATGSIILRACELGISFDDLIPTNPIQAMQYISEDPDLERKISLISGRVVTGLDLQEAIAIRAIEAAMDADYITDSELEWGLEWIDLIDDLRTDVEKCGDRVDWVIKWALILHGLEQPKKPKETDYSVAWAKALDYHKVHSEGAGMRMLRKGKFRLSPTAEMLDEGLPLPPTRANLRGETISLAEATDLDYQVDWQHVGLWSTKGLRRVVILKDPYIQESDRLDMLLAQTIAANNEQVVGKEGLEPSIR